MSYAEWRAQGTPQQWYSFPRETLGVLVEPCEVVGQGVDGVHRH